MTLIDQEGPRVAGANLQQQAQAASMGWGGLQWLGDARGKKEVKRYFTPTEGSRLSRLQACHDLESPPPPQSLCRTHTLRTLEETKAAPSRNDHMRIPPNSRRRDTIGNSMTEAGVWKVGTPIPNPKGYSSRETTKYHRSPAPKSWPIT